MIDCAGYQITEVVSDYFALDGGAMFGSVPKVLWNKRISADEMNRIPLACRLLLLRGHGRTILVDVGMGRKWSEKETTIFSIEPKLQAPLEDELGDVTDIIITHFHFDHSGGITKRGPDGTIELAFPETRVFASRKNFEHSLSSGPREKASYIKDNILPLEKSDSFVLAEDGQEILPEIHVIQADGHTHGLQWVKIGSGKGAVVFPSDLMPTAHHVQIPYVMGYDLSAEKSMEEKATFLEKAVADEWVVVFEHDRDTAAAILHLDERGRYAVREVVEIGGL